MTIRMKAKYYFCLTNVTRATYDPRTDNVEHGTQLWRERLALKELQSAIAAAKDDDDNWSAVLRAKYEAAMEAFFTMLAADKNKKHAPVVLTMDLRHGDMVCMHGHLLQARYEVCVPLLHLLSFLFLLLVQLGSSFRRLEYRADLSVFV